MASLEHWPAIPGITGEVIEGWKIADLTITTTVFSTWIFMVVLFIIVWIFYISLKKGIFPKIRTLWLDMVTKLDTFLIDSVGNKKYARIYFPMIGGFAFFILTANFFGLILDWLNISFPFLHSYLRPFNSDMSTTLALALTVIIVAHIAGMIRKWFIGHWKHFIFNFSGNSLVEKIINIPIGWIHLIGEMTRVLSLSVRLFANIFAGVALIAVVVYLGQMIPAWPLGWLIVLPIWFFEVLVACLQAFVFTMFTCLYIKEAVTIDHH